MQPVTLYLTVSVSLNTASHPEKRAGEAIRPSMAQDSMEATRSTVGAGFEILSRRPKDHLQGEITASMPPVAEADDSARMSRANNASMKP